jgi:uncharacterized hydrophobic protein (TIGR00271 family)
VVHLRIVVSGEMAPRVLSALDRSAAVSHIVHLPGTARRPQGDVVLCDVAPEAASIVLMDLQELGVPEHGSITVERPATVLSRAADEAQRASPGDPANAVVWEQVEELTSESTELTASFIAFITLATLITAVGIFLDSAILIIGGMVLGPEFGPLAGFSVAVVQGRAALARRSLLAILVGFVVAITAGFVASLAFKWTGLTPDQFTEADHGLSEVISNPDFFSFFVAFCAGIAGTLSLTTAKSGALTGVLISVTTIPAAANIAVAAAYEDWPAWRGSLEQLAINLAALCIGGITTLLIQRAIYRRRREAHLRDHGSLPE